jgi:enoyl-CoA hydratase
MPEPASPPFVLVERQDDGVAVVRLRRPPLNALSRALLEELADAARGLTKDLPGAVVLTGGDRAFAAGADVAEFGGPDEVRQTGMAFHAALDAIAAIPRATIAAIRGYALGGGCELAMTCDLRVAATDAKLGQPEILLGIIPGAGGTQRLTRLVGPARTKDLVLTGRQVGADEALRIGLVDRVVPPDEVLATACALAAELAKGALVAQALAKRAVDEGLDLPLAQALDLEQELFIESFRTEDARTGIQSFLEKGPGKAEFRGR